MRGDEERIGGGRWVAVALTLQRYPTLAHSCCSAWPIAHSPNNLFLLCVFSPACESVILCL